MVQKRKESFTDRILNFQEKKKRENGNDEIFRRSADLEKFSHDCGSPAILNSAINKACRPIPKGVSSLASFVSEIMKCAFFCDTFYVELSDNLFKELCCYHYLDINELAMYVEAALELGIFDAEIYKRFYVLTSRDMQKAFLLLNRERGTTPEICYRYWLTDPTRGGVSVWSE